MISDYISVNFVERIFESPAGVFGAGKPVLAYMVMRCRFTAISAATPIWRSASGCCWDSSSAEFQFSLSVAQCHGILAKVAYFPVHWLRDYLYIPGRQPKGACSHLYQPDAHNAAGGFCMPSLTRFIIWGGLHGVALAVERCGKRPFPTNRGYFAVPWAVMFHFVCFCWIFFRAENMDIIQSMLHQIVFDLLEIFPDFLSGYATVIFWMSLGYGLHMLPSA